MKKFAAIVRRSGVVVLAAAATAAALAAGSGWGVQAAAGREAAPAREAASAPVRAESAARTSDLWSPVAPETLADPAGTIRASLRRHKTVLLDQTRLLEVLAQAPAERADKKVGVVVDLPWPDGRFRRFRIQEAPVLAPELAAAHPEIRTYLGQGVDDPTATARLDWTLHGFHAIVLSAKPTVYVDPAGPGDTAHYVSYYAQEHRAARGHRCLVHGDDSEGLAEELRSVRVSHGSTLRTYRLAVAATGEYTVQVGGKASAISEIATAVNRLNAIYERDVAVRFTLVAGNDNLVFDDPVNDGYDNGNTTQMLLDNQTKVDAVIGSGNYDLAHVFGAFTAGDDGSAALGSACLAGQKAKGASGTSSPTGDPFVVDFVAHEIGHQLNATHTFNSATGGACGGAGERNAPTAVEPRSGSTIMAFAGYCGAENLQSHADAYFHTISQGQIIDFVTAGTGSTCGTTSTTGNLPPTATVPNTISYQIPTGTPFALTATGSDANTPADALTYSWEQIDAGNPSVADDGTNALLRAFPPTTSSTRIFPKVSALLSGTASLGETLPSVARTLNFRLTVRDNRAGGGGVFTVDQPVLVVSTGAAFAVTAPNTAVNWVGGTNQTVTWNPANTSAPPIGANTVKITMSTDGGNTFPITLLANTPNNGSATVVAPSVNTSQARVKVEAIGFPFFDVSDLNFSVTSVTSFFISAGDASVAENVVGGKINIPVDVSPTSGNEIRVNYATADGAAAGGSAPGGGVDYISATGTLVFAPGVTRTFIQVDVVDDGTAEADEDFYVNLSAPVGATISDAQGRGVIVNNDGSTSGIPTLAITDVSVTEGNSGSTNATFTVNMSAISGGTVTVDYGTQDGTATAVTQSPVTKTGTGVTINAVGEASPYPASILVPKPAAGSTPLGSVTGLTVSLNGFSHTWPQDVDILLVSPSNQAVLLMSDVGGTSPAAGLTLTFSDTGSAISGPLDNKTYRPTNLSDNQGLDSFGTNAPSAPYGTTLSSFNGTDPTGEWKLFVMDDSSGDSGSLTSWSLTIQTGGDYTKTSGRLTFVANQTVATFSVPVLGDTIFEPNETFFVNLTAPQGAILADAQGQGTIVNDDPPTLAYQIAQAIVVDQATLLNAEFEAIPPSGVPNAVGTAALAGFPIQGGTFGLLTSGDSRLADDPNNSGSSGADIGGGHVRGTSDFDVTILRLDMQVPTNVNCMSVDFRFGSDEFPEFVNTGFNDAFIAELDTSNWTTDGSKISAPRNFAFDPVRNVISINAAGVTSMNASNATGTTYDGATPVLRAQTPITPGAHKVYLSIFDQGDGIYDSAVFLDNLTFTNSSVCLEGAQARGVSKTAASSASTAGSNNSYTITLSNPFSTPVTVTSITDTLPAGFTYRTGTTTGITTANPTISGQKLTWTGSFALPGPGTFTLGFGVVVSTTPGEYFNNAEAVGVGPDGTALSIVPSGPTASVTVVQQVSTADLQLSISASPSPAANQNSDLTYTIGVVNKGPAEATVVVVDDTLPAGVTFVSASTTLGSCSGTTAIKCTLGTMAASGASSTATVTLVVKPTTSIPAGSTLSNAATVTGAVSDPNTANNSAKADVTINPPGLPTISVDSVVQAEQDSGQANFNFTAKLSTIPSAQVTVNYATSDGTATTAGSDYTATSGVLTFPASTTQLTQTIGVPVMGDTAIESNEAFTLTLSNAVNGTFGTGTSAVGQGTILDDDGPFVTASVSAAVPGQTVSALVKNASGTGFDAGAWVSLNSTSNLSDTTFFDWYYLNGAKTPPSAPLTTATINFTMPAVGQYEFRLFKNAGFERAAKSQPIAVTAATGPVIALQPGSLNFGTVNTGSVTDKVIIVKNVGAGSLAGTATVSGSGFSITAGADYTVAAGSSSNVIVRFRAPAVAGTYTGTLSFGTGKPAAEQATANLTVNVVAAPSVTFTPNPVAPGSKPLVTVANGPGNVRDWVGMYRTTDSDSALLDWYYLSGSKTTLPPSGLTGATLNTFTAPQTLGNYEFRFFANDSYSRLATSPVMVVQSPTDPTMSLSATSLNFGNVPVTGGAFVDREITVTNVGTGSTPLTGNVSVTAGPLDYSTPLSTTFNLGAGQGTVIKVRFTPQATGTRPGELRFTNSVTGQVLTVTLTGTGAASGPTVTPALTTANTNQVVNATVAGGPGNTTDWVGLYARGTANSAYLDWFYLNASKTAPSTGLTGGTIPFTMPTTAGTYEFRFFSLNSFTLLAQSAEITVNSPGGSATITLSSNNGATGSRLTIVVANGPATATDWVGIYLTGTADSAYVDWFYLQNGAQTVPTTGVAGNTVNRVAPSNAGTYEARFFLTNSYTRLATSSAVTLTAPTLTPNSISVAPGSTITVTFSGGPANDADWMGLFPIAGSDSQHVSWKYAANNTQTLPGSGTGVASGSVTLTAPGTTGQYNVRFFINNGATKIQTSATITVN